MSVREEDSPPRSAAGLHSGSSVTEDPEVKLFNLHSVAVDVSSFSSPRISSQLIAPRSSLIRWKFALLKFSVLVGTVTPRMSSTSSTLLLFQLLLGLFNPYLSTCQKWESFKRHQITSSAVINCDAVMAGECPETQSFIYTDPRILENVCKYITGQKNISKSKEFRVSTCKKIPNTSCSYGNAEVQLGVICLTCRNRKPVQFVKMGNC
ncbi:unnamed protein product [Ranitomeya imitator]|uniref:Ribonuclease A-domain domain-containing protein n=1 Tax=Ranitomeya imitator TaxID=111125 RepID=A0ABN9KUP9_9NEOB|nr:unnamed protein product [Ranitomeya imitator]